MLLQCLSEFANRLDLPPPLYRKVTVRYVIELDEQGNLLNPCPIDLADPTQRELRYGQSRLVPRVSRTRAIKPYLLADNAEYTLGIGRANSNPKRVSDCHKAYLTLLTECATQTKEPSAKAVLAYLSNNPTNSLQLPDAFDPAATLIFRVAGRFPTEQPAIQAFWAAQHAPTDAPVMQCLVCGENKPILTRWQTKVKGIPGGLSSGSPLISANQSAFESYGLSASLTSPTCANCAERVTLALNHLLRDKAHHLRLGDLVFVFWTRGQSHFSLAQWFDTPDSQSARTYLNSLRTGFPAKVDETAFYELALSANGGRVVVRDWLNTTIGTVKKHLADWFARQQIVGSHGSEPRPFSLYALAATTVRDPKKELSPSTPRALLRAALTNTPLPLSLLQAILRRNQAERDVTAPRAALIKLILLSHQPDKEVRTMVQLQPDHPSPAYQCGRLLAVLEQVQRLAIPGINSTIVTRFYGTASCAPSVVFSQLLRGAQPHLAKLERDRPGAAIALNQKLEAILGKLSCFPRTLNLTEQGLFALGYYHQRAHDYARARENAKKKKKKKKEKSDERSS